MTEKITEKAKEYIDGIVNSLEISPSRYEQAEKSYKSLGKWFERTESTIKYLLPDTFVQGSFRLGTVIKPRSEEEEYDIDCVCSLKALGKSDLSQLQLKQLIGHEVHSYRESKGITKPIRESRRCWTLEYSDGAQFHMDVVPSIPNGLEQRILLEARSLDTNYADSAIAITDNEVPEYADLTRNWPRSNPRGYSEWFKSCMGDSFVSGRQRILNEMLSEGISASIEDIPVYRVRTPLQSAIMILKRHRDELYANDLDIKPISIIITTLSAHAYGGEDSVSSALMSILTNMENAIEHDGEKYIIRNPTDGMENFADKWEEHPERATAFFDWLESARHDFNSIIGLQDYRKISAVLNMGIGRALTEQVEELVIRAHNQESRSLLRPATAASSSIPAVASFADKPRVPKTPDGFA